jgi:uncharacterized protein YegJ (DUF2314 family)
MVRKLILTLCLLTFACAPQSSAISTPTLSGTDPELDAAITQARDSLNTFVEKIATPHTDRTIVAVKVRFYPPDNLPQDIWVDGVTNVDDVFHGNMGDDIPSLRLKFGQKIMLDEKDILDWMIVEDGKLIGGYTIRLAMQRMSPEERARFLKSLDYTIDN